jgi:magnesium-transporting ATPase (P-type)
MFVFFFLLLPFKRKMAPVVHYGPNRQIYFNDDASNAQQSAQLKYASNVIVTSTYTLLSFLPLNMFEQFRKVANLYFLVVVILQFVPAISPVAPIGSIAALTFVIGVSAIRAAVEDVRRHRDDFKVNNSPAVVLKDNDFVEGIPWKDLKV